MFEDEVKTVSLDEPASDNIRTWCRDGTWLALPPSKPRLSWLDRTRVRVSNALTKVALWVLP